MVFISFPGDEVLFFNHIKNDFFQITPDVGHFPAPLFTGFPIVFTRMQLSVIISISLENPDLVKICPSDNFIQSPQNYRGW